MSDVTNGAGPRHPGPPRRATSSAAVVCSAVALAAAVAVAVALVWVVPSGGATVAVLVVVLVLVLVATPAVLVSALLDESRRRSTRDPLLDVANRAGLAEECAGWLTSLAGSGQTAATVVVVHFDDLRDLRLALGADSARALLAEAARRLSHLEGAVVARIDHDTLAVVRPVPLSAPPVAGDDALSLGEREGRAVRALLQQPVRLRARGLEVRPETSTGVACVPDHGTDLEELLAAADVALVTAAAAPSRVAVAEGAAVLDVDALALHAQLPAAIADGQLRVHYQPLVAAGSGRLVGVEALVRWQHPERGLLGPGAFVPLAERSQAILGLTEWVLRTAVAQTAAWRAAGHDLGVSVNVAAPVLAEESFLTTVQDVLDAHGLPPSVLTLEVTESALLEDPQRAAEVLSALRAAGARLSIDDFGTGYTSLTMLRELDVDELKIDRTFVDAAPRAASDAAIVRALVDLGHRLSMEVVAEGVEDARTADLMTRLGVDVLQGFHFARPVPADELLTALRASELRSTATRPASLLPGEEQRLADVRLAVPLLEASKPFLDTLAALAAAVCDRPVAAVTVVDEDLVRVLAGAGDAGTGGPRDELPCSLAVLGRTVFEVPDLLLDSRWAEGAACRGGMRSYAGAPLVDPRGHVLGVLCVSAPEPGRLSPARRELLEAIAALGVEHLQGAEAASVLPRLQALLQAMPELDRTDRRGELLDALADATVDLLGADLLIVTGPTGPDGGWGLLTQRGLPVDVAELAIQACDLSGVARAIRTQRPVWVPDTLTSGVLDTAHVQLLAAASVLIVPVVTAAGAEWVISAVWQTPVPDLPAVLRDGAVALASRAASQLDRAPLGDRPLVAS